MTAERLTAAAAWAVRRLATLGLYILAIIGASGWDRDNPSWFRIFLRLGGAAMFLWWAVWRTVDHWNEDQGDE
ncbi:hypothetical protein [Kribbella sp. NPDC050470]|uniref:hypothetical protein n=1 Tax=unclassified Kribbella TaxID=2644121 RepID=UPI0037A68FD0